MRTSILLRWLVVAVSAAMLLAVVAACAGETVEVPGETVVVEKEVIKTIEVPGETVVKEVVKEVMVPGETVVVKEEVVKEVMVPGETVVVEKEVVKTIEVPGQTVTKEVVKTVEVPGQTVVVEKEVVKTVEVPGQTVVVEKVVVQEVPGKSYVTDPSTGKVVTAPEYGGTLTYPYDLVANNTDVVLRGGYSRWIIEDVNEQLGIADWAIDRKVFDFSHSYIPESVWTGHLAESWEQPDPLTYVFHIRKGVKWQDRAPMNGRELTAEDVEYTYQRLTGMGKFEPPERTNSLTNLGIESIEATDKYTLVIKLKKPNLTGLVTLISEASSLILPPEVIEQYGDMSDWKNVVGTGPFILTEYVDGASITRTKNPDYWGFDRKYPDNPLPYVDVLKALWMKEPATRYAALRTGKIDLIHGAGGGTAIKNIDQVRALQETNPELHFSGYYTRSFQVFNLNTHEPPFDDVRVRKALQMALDLETINRTYFFGLAKWVPQGFVGDAIEGYFIPFEEWPEEVKKGYMYDPEGARQLLAEAGYPDGLEITAQHRDIQDLGYVEVAAGYWADIGVNVDIQVVDTAAMVASYNEHNYAIITGDSGWNNPPDWLMGVVKHPFLKELIGGGDPTMDALHDAFFAATTIDERKRILIEFDQYVIS